jgi:hypothetical protein
MAAIIITSGGGSAGLFSYRSEAGGFTISVLVLPKLWGKPRSASFEVRAGGARMAVMMSEYDTVSVSVPDDFTEPKSRMDALRQGILELNGTLEGRRARWKASQRRRAAVDAFEAQPVDTEVVDDPSTDLDTPRALEEVAEVVNAQVPVDCGLRFSLSTETAVKGDTPPDATPTLASALRDLVWLCYRNRKMKSSSDEGGGDETGGLLLDATTAEAQDPLALLAELDFVSELHRLQHRIRKGYVPEEDRLSAVRGRITDRGVLDFEMTGIPLLECRFDEFVEATPLFRVLVTALDVVASGSLRASLGVGSDWFGGSSDLHPATLREQLRNIPSLPLPVARATAERLRLTRLQYEWQRPLDLAKRILRAESVDTGAADADGGATTWSIEMPALWERVLTQALNRQPKCKATEQAAVIQPWQELGGARRADIELKHDGNSCLLDAKYKEAKNGASPADQYQIFAYSLLRTPAPRAVALVYPLATAEAVAPKRFVRHTPLNTGGSETKVFLHLLSVPFPSRSELSDDSTWHDYLDRTGAVLVRDLGVEG